MLLVASPTAAALSNCDQAARKLLGQLVFGRRCKTGQHQGGRCCGLCRAPAAQTESRLQHAAPDDVAPSMSELTGRGALRGWQLRDEGLAAHR